MRPNPIPVIAMLLVLCISSMAQVRNDSPGNDSRYQLMLRNGSFIPAKNITVETLTFLSSKAARAGGKAFAVIQFEQIPTIEQRKQLEQNGIELLDYIPNNAYTVTFSGSLNTPLLQAVKARAVVELTAGQKMQPELAVGSFPAWAVKIPGTIDVWINFPKTFSYEAVLTGLRDKNFDIYSSLYRNYRVIALRIAATRLSELALLPFVEYVQAAPHEDIALNNKSTVNARANLLSSSLPGGRNLRGEGVVIGIGDNADPLRHIDYTDRIINRAAIAGGAHGVHVTGITAGAGNIEEKYTGYAPKATIIAQSFSNILAYSPAYVQDHGMVITNNSFGNVEDDCQNFGYYEIYSRILDQQAFDMPNLINVFAGGNSGYYNCGVYPAGYGTVLSGYQSAKNIITVGATSENDSLVYFSSKGPVKDGRIKPEITAQGKWVVSSWPINTYSYNSGTSMASPAVSGGLALLYERYRQFHGGANPKNGLVKALLCNGATDQGNPGPDFTYGFGSMNLLRSVQMLENSTWFTGTVAPGATNTHTISIPATPAATQLKVMLYWNDSAAAVLAHQTLVNDLDLELEDPSLVTTLPQKLDTLPANINNAAGTGADHINNIEQVLINNPTPGATYTVKVKGTTIPSATPQEYFITYDLVPDSTRLTYPIGAEKFQAGDSLYISWDSWGNTSNTFKLEYSTDNGSSWTTINNSIAANLRQFIWFIPAVTTDQAKVRITNNGTGMVSTSAVFTIVGVPAVSLSAVQCEGYFSVDWTAVSGATDYEVMQLRGGEMVSVATTLLNTYTISGLSKDSVYWISVRARLNGNPGRRATALSRQPNSGTCAGTISDNDIKIDSFIAPLISGRKFTSTAFSSTVPVSIRIKNLDDAVTPGNITASYTINGGAPVTEIITNPSIAAGGTLTYTFTGTADLSAVGSYNLVVTISQAGDPVTSNNSTSRLVKQLDNPAITLASPFLDDIETATIQSYANRIAGLEGLDRYDFINSTVNGRLRSFINTGIAYSGSKALTLDAATYVPAGNTVSLTGTFNLAAFNTATDDIRLDFRYKNHDQAPNAANKVWIRGDDQKNWVQVYDLYADQNEPGGSYKLSSGIELSDSLLANSQNFSSSFQVRWGQWGQILAADNDGGAGYTFDDIRLYKVTDDIQMISIDTPIVSACALSAVTPVQVTIRNSSNSAIPAVPGIPVMFRVDGGSWTTETIPGLAANTSFQFTFTATANLSAGGTHLVETKVQYATDSYPGNDTLSVQVVNQPVINTFPYLENFESGTGYWYSTGKKSSWQYGTPNTTKINRAASGSKAWKTNSTGNYTDAEKSYLYSPCFDVSGMSNPKLSMSIALDLEDCLSNLCDGAYIEYSGDGKTWDRLGAFNQAGSVNWYNKNYTGNNLWSIQDYTRWHVATTRLPKISNLRLRIVMAADPSVTKEGIAIDDIHIYDSTRGIYTGPASTLPINQSTVNGTAWIDFIEPGSGQLVASINPNGLDLGNTDVQGFINTGAVRTNSYQYYHDRNITIKPQHINLSDSASVRFYFLDSETETLINATGCSPCSKPSTAYELGVSKYSDNDISFENGSILDDNQGTWLFINSANAVKVPFDKGYYAEFKVKNFSEFWLNNGGFNRSTPLPVGLINFTVKKKTNKDVLAEWTTASELDVARFEIEVARSNSAYQQNQFTKIGELNSRGNSVQPQQYSFTDAENNKSGVRYYRLKIVDLNGSFSYSVIRPVIFEEDAQWQVYPNPSAGVFNLVYQAKEGETITAKVVDPSGKLVKLYHTTANGFIQKLNIDLLQQQFAAGLYLLEVNGEGEKKHFFKLIKR